MTTFSKKQHYCCTKFDADTYINALQTQSEQFIPLIKKTEKLTTDAIVPCYNDCNMIYRYNYNIQHLKSFAKAYKLKLGGNKKELQIRLFTFLRLSHFVVRIQKIFRGKIQRKYNNLHGPAALKREICTNESDFFTMDPIKELPMAQFFSYKDVDGFVYGFDIISLYNLIQKSGKTLKNPYNRMEVPAKVILDIKHLIKLSKLLNISIEIDIKDVTCELSNEKSLELRVLDLFQNIDSLGNYSSPVWFLSLNRIQIVKFVRELSDIWNYRAQITTETKRNVCPPNGDPFRNLSITHIMMEENIDIVRKLIIGVLEKFVNSGIDRDSQSLGAYYVLGALTIVNENAATSLPWLFQSFSYF